MVVGGFLLAVAVGVPVVGCSSDSPEGIGNGHTVPTDGGTYACADNATRACFVTIGEHNGVLTCYEGTQTCVEGGWTECGNGTITNKKWSGPYKPASGMRTMALTDASACDNNPCDPTCQNFDGDPDVISQPDVIENWISEYVGGSVAGLPKGLVYGKGIVEPCEWGAECQFNHECTNVATDAVCVQQHGHGKCTAGVAFEGACRSADPCVNAVCNAQASCCGSPCAHDPCIAGAKLEKSCDTCVSSICDVMPECCTGSWTTACVAAIGTVGGGCAGKMCVCPTGSSRYPNDATGRCYRYLSGNRRWNDARTACQQWISTTPALPGATWDLAIITSEGENNFAKPIVTSGSAWIGLTRASGSWLWWDNTALSGFAGWTTAPTSGCGRIQNSATSWTAQDCSNNTSGTLCEGPGTVLSPATSAAVWDSTCVDKVKTVCDATCGTGTGKCVPRPPGSIDTSCVAAGGKSGIDLSVAVPCDNAIPICNHGTVTAPAGIPIVHYPGNSPHYGVCNPPYDNKAVTCSTSAPIPPGECIWVTTCGLGNPGIGSNRQIYVNPSWLSGHQAGECSCLDNWSESHRGVPCLDPVCATTGAEATLKTVNMYLIIDKSGSMGFAGNGTTNTCTVSGGVCNCDANSRWTGAKNALSAFIQSGSVDSMNLSLEMYPHNAVTGVHDGCGWMNGSGYATDCSASYCQNAYTPLGSLGSTTHELSLLAALSGTCPFGGTPTYPAMDGTIDAAVAGRIAKPEEVHVAVLVSDGEPTSCNPSAPYVYGNTTAGDRTAMINLAADAFAQFTTNPVRTYTIGIGNNQFKAGDVAYDLLNSIAAQGGGGSIIKVDTTNSSTVETQLLNALLGIASNSVTCEFTLPDLSTYNPNDVTVLYSPGPDTNGKERDAVVFNPSTTGTGGCDWYYDNQTNPTKITLCTTACATVTSDPLASIEVLLGCPTNYDPAEGVQSYKGTCPPGTRVQWGYFAYDTATPLDSYVEFWFRTGEAEPLTSDYALGGTASAASNTQVCPMTGGQTGCPLDLYDLLDTPAAFMPVIEVKALAYPSTSGHEFPTINDWQITYSCPSTE
jgi:hypothetical protein